MLSFLATLPIFPFTEKSCHLLFPASSSLFAFTFRGTLAGLTGPSLTLLGSRRAWVASAGSMSAAAEMTLVLADTRDVDDDAVGRAGDPSALRFFESLEMGLMSLARRVSVVE